jgi:hypothetical protein
MSFFKHVGTANGTKKVIIIQRQLPGEEHMAGVIYSEIIPSRFHDDLMKELESEAGQAANEFKEVLERRYFSDGQNMLQVLHGEGWIKKVATNNVIVRPNSKSSLRLDELNKLLNDMRTGRIASQEIPVQEETAMSDQTVSAEQLAPKPAPVEEDRLARLEKMMLGLAETVQSMAEKQAPKKSAARQAKTS